MNININVAPLILAAAVMAAYFSHLTYNEVEAIRFLMDDAKWRDETSGDDE